jgi:hypothetical protein
VVKIGRPPRHTTAKTAGLIRDFLTGSPRQRAPATEETAQFLPGAAQINIGLGSLAAKGGNSRVAAASRKVMKAVVKRVGCVGMCQRTPMIEVVVPGRLGAFIRVSTRRKLAAWWRVISVARSLAAAPPAFDSRADTLLVDEAEKSHHFALFARAGVARSWANRCISHGTIRPGGPLDLMNTSRTTASWRWRASGVTPPTRKSSGGGCQPATWAACPGLEEFGLKPADGA